MRNQQKKNHKIRRNQQSQRRVQMNSPMKIKENKVERQKVMLLKKLLQNN